MTYLPSKEIILSMSGLEFMKKIENTEHEYTEDENSALHSQKYK